MLMYATEEGYSCLSDGLGKMMHDFFLERVCCQGGGRAENFTHGPVSERKAPSKLQ